LQFVLQCCTAIYLYLPRILTDLNTHTQNNIQIYNSIWTKGFAPEMKTHIPLSCRDLTYIAQVDDLQPWSTQDLIDNIKLAVSNHAISKGKEIQGGTESYYTISGCIAGGEAGVDMADLLSEQLGVLTNGTKGDYKNRRDKKVQQKKDLHHEPYQEHLKHP